jgi:hypothetical protein
MPGEASNGLLRSTVLGAVVLVGAAVVGGQYLAQKSRPDRQAVASRTAAPSDAYDPVVTGSVPGLSRAGSVVLDPCTGETKR